MMTDYQIDDITRLSREQYDGLPRHVREAIGPYPLTPNERLNRLMLLAGIIPQDGQRAHVAASNAILLCGADDAAIRCDTYFETTIGRYVGHSATAELKVWVSAESRNYGFLLVNVATGGQQDISADAAEKVMALPTA